MADVVTALARAARDLGHDARIVMPKFDCLDYSSLRDLQLDRTREFWVGSAQVAVWTATLGGVPTVLLEPQDGSVW
jgi:glycogen synthase